MPLDTDLCGWVGYGSFSEKSHNVLWDASALKLAPDNVQEAQRENSGRSQAGTHPIPPVPWAGQFVYRAYSLLLAVKEPSL